MYCHSEAPCATNVIFLAIVYTRVNKSQRGATQGNIMSLLDTDYPDRQAEAPSTVVSSCLQRESGGQLCHNIA